MGFTERTPTAEDPKSLLGILGWEPRPVKLHIENSVHYQLRTPLGAAEFAKLLPSNGHLVHLRNLEKNLDEEYPHTIAMFHQLRCLDIIRRDYVSGIPEPLREHCINYLRQSILCLADVRLESVRSLSAPTLVFHLLSTTVEYADLPDLD